MTSTLTITPRTHWFNGWFLQIFARPVIIIDSCDLPGTWGRPSDINIPPGNHSVAVGARYRGTKSILGTEEIKVDAPEGKRLYISARNGFLNHQPFVLSFHKEDNM